MRNFVFLIGCAIGITLSAQQKSKTDAPLGMDPKARQGVLPNGMKYYVRYNARPAHRAELRLAVNAGSTYESDEQQGLAHFVEHMAFNGTKNFEKNELVNYLEGLGAKFGPDLNAYTSFDETVYMLQIPTDKPDVFKKGFLILEDWAHNLTFDSAEVEKERGVVTEEWRLGQGAWDRMNRKYWPVLFKDSRYADRMPIGKPEILKTCKQSLLCDYYKDWYRPDLQAIVVVGDINVDSTVMLIKRQFSGIPVPKSPKPVQSWQVPDQKDLRVSVVSDAEAPYNVLEVMYFQDPKNVKTVAEYREHLKRNLFNGMISARLSELTKKPDASILYGGAGYNSTVRNKDAYNSWALFANGKAKEAINTVVVENERVKRYGFNATELERKKRQIVTDYEQRFNEREKTESRELVDEYVQHFLTGDAVPGIEKEFELVKSLLPGITLQEVNALGSKWIRPNGQNAMLILMMTEKEGAGIPSEAEAREVFFKSEKSPEIKRYEDKTSTLPLLTSEPAAGKITATNDKGYGVTEFVLSNGARVLAKPTDFKDDEVLMDAQSWGGSGLYSLEEYQSADASNAVQERMGFGNYDEVGLEKYLQDKKASLSTGVGHYDEGLQGSSSKKDLPHLMQLIYAAFREPRYDSSAFLSWIQQQKGIIQNMSADPGFAFRDSVRYIMSGYDPRSAPETPAKLDEVKLNRAYTIYKERFLDPADFVFTIVGSFTLDEIKPLIEKYIGGIGTNGKKESWKDLGTKVPSGNINKTFTKGHEPRSTVQLMWTGETKYERRNRFSTYALTSLLNIKLRESLREDRGGVYGVYIYPSLTAVPKERFSITCGFSCEPAKTDELIKAAKEVINNVKTNGCNDADLGKVKETLLKEREIQLRENRFWLSYISNTDRYNEKLSDLDMFSTWAGELSSDKFKRDAATYFKDGELKQFVLNPEETKVDKK